MPVVSFERIENVLPDYNGLITDQKYLADIHNAGSTGLFSFDLEHNNPSNITHTRWMTFSNKTLHLYVVTEHPTHNLIIIR